MNKEQIVALYFYILLFVIISVFGLTYRWIWYIIEVMKHR